jgi:transcriptional regulator with XRE-family HTH domain
MDSWTTTSHTFRTFLLVAQIDPEGIRARIRLARKEAGLTQEQLATLIDRHKRTVENYERVRVPDYAELGKIARVLNRPIEWFLHGDAFEDDAAAIRTDLEQQRRLLEAIDRKLDLANPDARLAAIERELSRLARAVGSSAP